MIVLKIRNIAIGQEMGMVGFTNDPVSTIISPTLTTVAEPAFDIGRISCELLLNHLNKSPSNPGSYPSRRIDCKGIQPSQYRLDNLDTF